MNDVWILGAGGRSGRAITRRLAKAQISPVLVGRDGMGLRNLAATIDDDTRVVTVDSIESLVPEIARNAPKVVLNTIGPFVQTALPIAQACPPGTHYVDLSNEIASILAILELNEQAVSSQCTFVTGAGFGVLAAEGLVMSLCDARSQARSIRVDTVPMVHTEPSRVGSALAASIIAGLAVGGLRYANGKLQHMTAFGEMVSLSLPDGSQVMTGAVPAGDLEAVRRASGAESVVAASSMMPASSFLRSVLPVGALLLRLGPLRNLATWLLAGTQLKSASPDAEYSWVHASVEWPSGVTRQGWLRTGDAMAFTAAAAAEIVLRLIRDEGRPGAYTPGALFGAELAGEAGAEFLAERNLP